MTEILQRIYPVTIVNTLKQRIILSKKGIFRLKFDMLEYRISEVQIDRNKRNEKPDA